jgi:hypothetical protein
VSSYRYTEINCDASGNVLGSCGQAFSDAGTAAQVRARAKAAGWSTNRSGGLDFCPKHRSAKS